MPEPSAPTVSRSILCEQLMEVFVSLDGYELAVRPGRAVLYCPPGSSPRTRYLDWSFLWRLATEAPEGLLTDYFQELIADA